MDAVLHYRLEMDTAVTNNEGGCCRSTNRSEKRLGGFDKTGGQQENCTVTMESGSSLTATQESDIIGLWSDANNNNQRNKIFSIQTMDTNCSQTAAPHVAQQLLHEAQEQQQPQQQQQQQQQLQVLSAVPTLAWGPQDNANAPATQEVNFNAQNYPEQGYSQGSHFSQHSGYPQQPGYPQHPGYPQQPGYPQPMGYPQQGYYYAAPGPPQGYGYPQGSYPAAGQGYPPPPPPPPPPYGGSQGYPYQQGYEEVTIVYGKLETPEERLKFIRGVYTILVLQLTVLFGFVLLCSFQIVYVGCSLSICCFAEKMMSTNTFSVSVLVILTGSLTLLVGFVSSTSPPNIVLLAIGVTLLVTLALTLVACTCTFDFTQLLGVMLVILTFLILFGFAVMLFGRSMPILHIIYAYAGAVIFSVYIIIDTQMLMSGKKYSMTSDMVIFGALNLFLDIVNLFLYLLQILNAHND